MSSSNIHFWALDKSIEIRSEISENITKISNIEDHVYLQTVNNCLYHGIVQIQEDDSSAFIELELEESWKIIDIDSCMKDNLYLVTTEGNVYKCTADLELLCEISLIEDCVCIRGHGTTKCKMRVSNIAVGDYGQLFITENGQLWASGYMPQIGINSEIPRKVPFFSGRLIHSVNIGNDFAIAIVNKTQKSDFDGDEEDVFVSNCPQCLSTSQLTSPLSQNSISELCPLGTKIQGSYDIETTSTSSKNDSTTSSNDPNKMNGDVDYDTGKVSSEKNIIFRNTEAAKEFLTRQISRMSSAGEEYLVECTEKPTRIIKENMTNVASFVYEGVKTVGDKVVTLSRHVSGSSDCNSVIENNDDLNLPKSASKDDCGLSLSQCTSEKDLSEHDVVDRLNGLLKIGSSLINCEVWTWGNIIHGQLGIGDKIKRERPMIITKLSNIGVRRASVQNLHASVLTLDGRAYIWGRNDHNQVTMDSNSDQSSPKLYVSPENANDRVKDIVCGESYTAILGSNSNVTYFGKGSMESTNLYTTNTHSSHSHREDCGNNNNGRVVLFKNLLSSSKYTILNSVQSVDNFFSSFLQQEQKFLEETLIVHGNIIKPLQKKNTNSPNSYLLDGLCMSYVDLIYFWAANVQSLLECSNNNGMISQISDVLILKNLEEFIYVYRKYLNVFCNVVSIDGFANISKLIEIGQSLFKMRPETFTKKEKNGEEMVVATLLSSPIERLDAYNSFIQNYANHASCATKNREILKKWSDLVDDKVTKWSQAESTRDFWHNSGKVFEFLKEPNRRLIRDSHKFPLHLQNSSRFSSHWFVLFSDLFVHVNGSSPHSHVLSTIWIEPQQEETCQQFQICLKMPEETLVLYTTEPESKIEWFHTLQNAIKVALNKVDALQPPSVRSGTYTFAKSGFLKDATYTGRWLNGKMHGNGKIEWSDGKTYTGQFSGNSLSGFGIMDSPNVGTYEGQWKDNQQNGFGIFNYANTDVYKGHFKDGLPHGHGSLRKGNFMAHTASFYIGDWVAGTKNGYGVMDDIVTGEKYIGNWLENKKNGNGLIVTSDGIYYEGIFNQDTMTGQGVMILEDGTHYEGEFRGTGVIYGKGTLTLPSGHSIEGNLTGSWSEGIKISNGTFNRNSSDNALPKSFKELCTPVNQKWKALFRQCHQVLGVPEGGKNGAKSLDTVKIWQNVAVYLSNASSTKLSNKSETNKFQNTLHHLDIIPPFGRDILDLQTYTQVRHYLAKAFESSFHPLGSLLTDLSEAYTTTYGGRAHPLLLSHAIAELHYICKRLYDIVRFLFPALPAYDQECLVENEEQGDEIINYQSLLYPLILPKVHHPLFTLFTLNNELQERQYKRTLIEWNKQSDYTLMAFLSVDQKFLKIEEPMRSDVFEDAIETLQQLKSTFSPTEKLLVIRQTVEKMTPVAQDLLGKNYVWNMDDLFPIFLFVVVRARIPELGAELDFVDNFMDPSLESGELGIMYTTLKASYQQILQEKTSSY